MFLQVACSKISGKALFVDIISKLKIPIEENKKKFSIMYNMHRMLTHIFRVSLIPFTKFFSTQM